MSYETLITRLGFQSDPFSDSDADREDRLVEYFIPPPFFAAVLGSPTNPGSDIVFAPRGAGKTAIKRRIEESDEHNRGRFLGVVYNRFDDGARRLADVDLERHINNIIELILVALVEHVRQNAVTDISNSSRRILYWLVEEHLSTIQQERLHHVVGAIQLGSDTAREWWNRVVGPANTIIGLVSAALGTTVPMVDKFKTEPVNLGGGLGKLKGLSEIAREVGFESIYVLVDKVDESHLTSNDAARAFQLVEPMLRNLDLIFMPGFGFKFFLWNELQQLFTEQCRPDRIPTHNIEWTQQQLVEMFRKRLLTFSDQRVSSVNDIVATYGHLDVEQLLVFFADGSPRQIIRLCREILKQQSELDDDTDRVSFAAIERGIASFSQSFTQETVGQQIRNELSQLHQIEYTVPIIGEVLEMAAQSARNKHLAWTRKGVVVQTGRQRTGRKGKASRVYALKSALVAISALTPITLLDFIGKKVRVCRDCGVYSLADFDEREDVTTCASCRKEALVLADEDYPEKSTTTV